MENKDRVMNLPDDMVYDFFECDGNIIYLLDLDKITKKDEKSLLFMKLDVNEEGEYYLKALEEDEIKRVNERYSELKKIIETEGD